MKANFTNLILIAGMFCLISLTNSCAKADHSADIPKEEQVVGKWNINRIQLKIYVDGIFIKDTIVKQSPKPENFVKFDANGGFEYRFNTATSDIGTYKFAESSSLVSTSTPNTYSWTTLTITNVLFTVVSKGADPAFPGALVERYQTFVR